MQKKSSNVQHFKIKPSQLLRQALLALYLLAFILILFCSLEWYFKVLLSSLLGLEFLRQQTLFKNKKHLSDIEVRDNNIFLKRKNDDGYHPVIEFKLQQNRIFAEIKLQLKDKTHTEFISQDRFSSRAQYCLFLQYLRFNHS